MRANEHGDDGSSEARCLPRTVAVFHADCLFALYQVATLKTVLEMMGDRPRVLVLGLEGLAALDPRALRLIQLLTVRCRRGGTCLIIGGAGPQPSAMLARVGLLDEIGPRNVFTRMGDALVRARLCAGE
jgi:sulfate permease, SulP family